MDSLSLANKVVHVADICTCVLHPASSTHRQLTDEQLVAAGITPGLIRLSVGLEHIDDILDDLKKGFAAIPLNGSRPVGMKRGAEHFLLCAAFCFARRQKVFRKLKQNVCACV